MNKLYLLVSIIYVLQHSIELRIQTYWKYDPELFMNATQVIAYHGYPVEDHEVTTVDGYILSMQRIPYGRENKTIVGKRNVVFLQHGLIDSSFTFVNNPPNESLGFILADEGFDVWLGNIRGNVYSNRHVRYSSKTNKFWDFSWDEMVQYDLDAMIDYVINYTQVAKLSYIGHSQGTMIGFAKFSQNSNINSKISSFTAMAPVVYVGHLNTAIKYLSYVAGGMKYLFDIFSHGQFLPSDKITQLIAKLVCGDHYTEMLCTNVLYLVAGYDTDNLNMTRLPVYVAHTPAGTSVKNMVHYAQGYSNKKFKYYDYGWFGNLKKYGQSSSPEYELNTHGLPVGMFWGGNDKLADPSDVALAIRQLGENVKYQLYLDTYNHMDFIWGDKAADLLYKDVLIFIRKYL